MRRSAILVMIFSVVLTLVLPFVGGSGPSLLLDAAHADGAAGPMFASDAGTAPEEPTAVSTHAAASEPSALTSDDEHLAQKPVPEPVVAAPAATGGATERRAAATAAGVSCPGPAGGTTGSAPARTAGGGLITGTTSDDLASFASRYNAIRVANCLQPVPLANIRYDSCMEDRLVWMAEDPSDDPFSAWGHIGSVRSDGLASVGCDGNLAGGTGNSGATVADKWWNSPAHQASLYKPGFAGATAGVCVYFAMTHGGVGATANEPASFARAAARWGGC